MLPPISSLSAPFLIFEPHHSGRMGNKKLMFENIESMSFDELELLGLWQYQDSVVEQVHDTG